MILVANSWQIFGGFDILTININMKAIPLSAT